MSEKSPKASGPNPSGPDSSKNTPAESSTAASSVTGTSSSGKGEIAAADAIARQPLPKWGQGKSKRRPSPEQQAEVLEADNFDRGVQMVGRSAFNHVYLVVGVIVVIAGLIAGGQAWMNAGDESRAKGTRALQDAVAPLARGRVVPEGQEMPSRSPNPVARSQEKLDEKASAALRTASAAGDAGVELAAMLASGSMAMRQGDAKAAVGHYHRFMEKAPKDHPMRALGEEGLALAFEDLERYDDAFKTLEDSPRKDLPRLQWHRARLLHALSRNEEAKVLLQELVTRDQRGLEGEMAKSLLQRIDAGAPSGASPAKDPAKAPEKTADP